MSRLSVDIDPVAIVRNVFGSDVPDPAQLVVLAELGGAESIVCYLREDLKTVNERDVRILREIVKTHLNVRCTVDEENLRKLLKIKPDTITFVGGGSDAGLEPKSLNIDAFETPLANYVADLRANNISVSVLIEPLIDQVRLAAKLEFDYIEINADIYANAEDLDQEIAELENLNSLALAASRLGLGVNASGKLNQENIPSLTKIQYLDDVIVGQAIAVKALSIGFEQAVRDYISIF